MKKVCIGLLIMLSGVASANLVLFQDNFNTANNTNLNADITTRISGSSLVLQYAPTTNTQTASWSILNNTLQYTGAGVAPDKLFLVATNGAKKNLTAELAGKKYEIKVSFCTVTNEATDAIALVLNSSTAGTNPVFSAKQLKSRSQINVSAGGAVNPNFDLWANGVTNNLTLAVDETGSTPSYVFSVNGNSITNGNLTFADANRYVYFTLTDPNANGLIKVDDFSITQIATAATTYSLTVNGGSGSGSYTNGQQVTIMASNAPTGKTFDVWTVDTQYLASVASFASNTVIMSTNAATLTATYKDLVYTLTGSAGANGTVTPSSTNVVYGSNADFVVTASNYYRIASLTTNGTAVTGMTFDSGSTSTNFTWSNVLADGTLAATFTAQLATDPAGTPYAWLAGYGLTNFDTDAVADQDLDGLKTWQEYIAGTDPTNSASCLKVAQTNRNTVTWSPVAGRTYSIYWSTNLVHGFTNLAAGITYPQGSYTNTTPDAKVNHYQVKVQMQ